MDVKSSVIAVAHVRKSSDKSFDEVITAFEKQLGAADMQVMLQAIAEGDADSKIGKMEGSSGLMIFSKIDMASAIPSMAKTERKARQYLIGNPLIASEMISHNIEVGLYVPLRVFVAETEIGTMFVYDQPTSVLGQWHSYKIDEVTKSLDEKLETLIERALS